MQFEAVNVIYLYKIPITWISSYFCLQRFSSIFESIVRLAERMRNLRHYRLLTKSPQFLTLQLTNGVHGDNEGHKYSRPITLIQAAGVRTSRMPNPIFLS